MESRKVRRPLCERRPEHFYQDFMKFHDFLPMQKLFAGSIVHQQTNRTRKRSSFKNEKKENSIKHVFRVMLLLLLLPLLLHVFVAVVQKLTIFS